MRLTRAFPPYLLLPRDLCLVTVRAADGHLAAVDGLPGRLVAAADTGHRLGQLHGPNPLLRAFSPAGVLRERAEAVHVAALHT